MKIELAACFRDKFKIQDLTPFFVLALLLISSSCQNNYSKSTAPLRDKIYSHKTNMELRKIFPYLPETDELVKQTEEDRRVAETLGKEVVEIVGNHYESHSRKWIIKAARRINNTLLLWIEFPHVDDGADHLIYSIEERAIVGTFFGGYLG